MKTPHHDRATPVLEALIAGPMTRQELAQKTGFNLGHISDTLCNLKALGRVARGERRTWSLRSGGAVAPAGSRRKGQRVAPPRARGESLVPVNGAGPRWFLGNDGSVRLEHNGAAIELDPGQFDTLRRAHAVIKAASAPEA